MGAGRAQAGALDGVGEDEGGGQVVDQIRTDGRGEGASRP